MKKKPITYQWESAGCLFLIAFALLRLFLFKADSVLIIMYSTFMLISMAILIYGIGHYTSSTQKAIKNGYKIIGVIKAKEIKVKKWSGEPDSYSFHIYFENDNFEIEVLKSYFSKIEVGDEIYSFRLFIKDIK